MMVTVMLASFTLAVVMGVVLMTATVLRAAAAAALVIRRIYFRVRRGMFVMVVVHTWADGAGAFLLHFSFVHWSRRSFTSASQAVLAGARSAKNFEPAPQRPPRPV